MTMIRSQALVPEVYVNGSRDFEMLCNLFDVIFNDSKYYADSIRYVTDTMHINADMLQLLSTKVGFESKKVFNDRELRYILQSLPLLVRGKGSMGAVKKLLNMCLKLYNVSANYEISATKTATVIGKIALDAHTLVIGIESILDSTELIREIGKYILPTGFTMYVYFYQGMSLSSYVEYKDSLEVLYSSDNLNSQLRPWDRNYIGAEEDEILTLDYSLDTMQNVSEFITTVTDSNGVSREISIFTPHFSVVYDFNDYVVSYTKEGSEDVFTKRYKDCYSAEEARELFMVEFPDYHILTIVKGKYTAIIEGCGKDKQKAIAKAKETYGNDINIIQCNRNDTLFDSLIGNIGSTWVYAESQSPLKALQDDSQLSQGDFLGVFVTQPTLSAKNFDVCVFPTQDGEYITYQTYMYMNEKWNALNFIGTYKHLWGIGTEKRHEYDVAAIPVKSIESLNKSTGKWEATRSVSPYSGFLGEFDSLQDVTKFKENDICYVKPNNRYYTVKSGNWEKCVFIGQYFSEVERSVGMQQKFGNIDYTKIVELRDISGNIHMQGLREQCEAYKEAHKDVQFEAIVEGEILATTYGAKYFMWAEGKWQVFTYPLYMLKSYLVGGEK